MPDAPLPGVPGVPAPPLPPGPYGRFCPGTCGARDPAVPPALSAPPAPALPPRCSSRPSTPIAEPPNTPSLR
ncbi:hypothetical protein [Streptomyces sp. CB02923]|uniref:hypothetical protein n=1 Tax=Streptomyces sp. CB02923 TaxID=1718985 RepID=UPI001F5BD09E|nr:hypothetical protein [Streptomyces sp. CB02923]